MTPRAYRLALPMSLLLFAFVACGGSSFTSAPRDEDPPSNGGDSTTGGNGGNGGETPSSEPKGRGGGPGQGGPGQGGATAAGQEASEQVVRACDELIDVAGSLAEDAGCEPISEEQESACLSASAACVPAIGALKNCVAELEGDEIDCATVFTTYAGCESQATALVECVAG